PDAWKVHSRQMAKVVGIDVAEGFSVAWLVALVLRLRNIHPVDDFVNRSDKLGGRFAAPTGLVRFVEGTSSGCVLSAGHGIGLTRRMDSRRASGNCRRGGQRQSRRMRMCNAICRVRSRCRSTCGCLLQPLGGNVAAEHGRMDNGLDFEPRLRNA